MPGPTPTPKRIVLPTLTGEQQKGDNPFMKQPLPGGSSSFMSNPLTARGPFSGGGQAAANSTPVNYNSSLFSNSTPVNYNPGLFNSTPVNYNPGLFSNSTPVNSPFANQYTDTSYGGQQDIYRGGTMQFNRPSGGTGSAGQGLHPEEMRWKSLADKYGVNWDVTKSVYMRSPRNPSFSPAVALNLQLDDKAFGDAARQFGILTGDPDYDANVWRDWYNSGGDINRSPLAGHNYAVMQYEANQKAIENMVNGVPKPPEWL